jgi:hypothetical protein
MTTTRRPINDDRARLALEQALLLVHHLQNDEKPDYRFVRAHALTLLQLVDGIDDEGIPRNN